MCRPGFPALHVFLDEHIAPLHCTMIFLVQQEEFPFKSSDHPDKTMLIIDANPFMAGLDFYVLSFPYLPTLVSSNAPKARSEAFCASESP